MLILTNGFKINLSAAGTVPVGRLHVNGIGQLQRLDLNSDAVSSTTPNVSILDPDSDDDTGVVCPPFLYFVLTRQRTLNTGFPK